MLTGTCSLRSRFRKGSCKSCPLLLTIFSVLEVRCWNATPYHSPGFPRTALSSGIGEGILRGTQLDLHRRAHQLVVVADAPFQITLVDVADAFQRVAVDDDNRRVHPTLVGVAQLRTRDA